MSERLKLAVIIGSTREGRWGPVPSEWIAEQAEAHGDFEVDLVDLREAGLPQYLGERDMWATPERPSEPVAGLGERLHRADAFVVVTPEYNHSYPAQLKHAIDYFMHEWHAKPVGLISYGAGSGGVRAVEHLRQIFPEVRAMTIRHSLAFPMYWEKLDENGEFTGFADSEPFAKAFLDELRWWARALVSARKEAPLPA
ncbi:NADPH-dependent FMN reductase [Glycomyces xiaoerkulensis]|uniref:NADPH-dependent FMN reductase n=1 Tax=Glycomyces xiaoerkulensis TaxID=2038139 RepID=UPI000C25B4F7|nr:NAD(P)H-dependent oxidoreductase [Glycomyces xiaoerkulensis]